MSSEGEQCLEQVKEEEEGLITPPERPSFSPTLQESNHEMCSASKSNDIDKGTPDADQHFATQVAVNSTEPIPSEITENVSEPQEITLGGLQNHSKTNRVIVKEEPFNEDVDHDMPIAKTPRHTSAALNEQISDMDCDTLETTANNTSEKGLQDNGHSIGIAAKLATHVAGNSTEPIPTEITEKVSEPQEITFGGEQNHSETNRVIVKEEPFNEDVDHDMPIAKTPRHTSAALNEQISDMDCDTLDTTANNTAEKGLQDNGHSNGIAAKLALDAYLDGLETPIAPIRVKAEFALLKTTLSKVSDGNEFLNNDSALMDAMSIQPPPPPIFSSNCNSDIVAEGIATPRISLAAINRLRVKTEFSMLPSPPQHNEHASDDQLVTKTKRSDTGAVSPSISDEESENEPIPEDFFDDLLHDKLKERIEEAQNNDLEEKYSDRLKEYERLLNLKSMKEKSKARQKSRKKQKKSKKKSRKRSRSRSLSPSRKNNDRRFDDLPGLYNYDRNKRGRVSPSRREMASTSNYAHIGAAVENCSRLDSGFRIKSEFSPNILENTAKESPNFENVEEIEVLLTPKQKRDRAIKRATALLNYLNKSSDENSTIFSTFPFVSTVRKLPTSHSYVQQQIYENRSPLHIVNNVSYKFNSHTSRFNMEEWGLAALPSHAAKIAKLVGCDAEFIHNKLKTIKIPAKLKKVKQEPNDGAENEEEEELIETNSSLYSNAMTQTDDVSEFDMPHKAKGYEIGVQAVPSVYSIGSQTLETQSPTEDLHKGDEAPIMKIMHDLNENQLMAIHAFAELIKEPNTNANAMAMYKIQMQILDIYKMSQIPSALLTSQNPIVNNYTTMTAKHRNQPQISIQSVKGADGKQFSVNDPRSKSAAYAKRIVDDAGPSNYNSRYTTFSQPSNARPSSYSTPSGSSNSAASRQRQNPAYTNQMSPATTKHYGRGGLRR